MANPAEALKKTERAIKNATARLEKAESRHEANQKRAFEAHNKQKKYEAASERLLAEGHKIRGRRMSRKAARRNSVAKRNHDRAVHFEVEAKAIEQLIKKLDEQKAQIESKLSGPTTMFDSVTVGNIPKDAKAVAGYVGGAYPTYHTLLQMFPRAEVLSIAINASEDAECLDVEPGDAVPSQAPAWVRRQHGRGVKRPVVYASASNMPQVLAELNRAGIKRDSYRIWTAHYTNKHICGPHTCGYINVDADGTQWTTHGERLDESVLVPSFFN